MAEDIDMLDVSVTMEESHASEMAEEAEAEAENRETADSADNEATGEEDESDSVSGGEPYLAVTRERRSNAGSRMAKLLQLAEAEQDVEEYGEIFQEAVNDQEFEEEDENDEDVNMDSSSEEDEAEGEQDDDAAERELKRQEKRENAKKQKRQSLLQQMMKKRTGAVAASAVASGAVGTSSSPTPSRPKKKSERVSWLPEDDQQATRASSRKLAVINKQATTERLKEKEKHRLRTVEVMKAAEQRKEALKPKAMTQADRLAEAARIERENSRSVRKWEEVEKRKEEERKARIAAAKNRKLEGPVISYWSGPALWLGDRRVHVGKGKQVAEFLTDSKRAEDAHGDVSVHEDKSELLPVEDTLGDVSMHTDESKPLHIEDTPGDVSMHTDEPKLSPPAQSQPVAEAVAPNLKATSTEAEASIPNPTAPEQRSKEELPNATDNNSTQPSQHSEQQLGDQPSEQSAEQREEQQGEQPEQSPLSTVPATESQALPQLPSTANNDPQPGATLSEVLQQSTPAPLSALPPTSTPVQIDQQPLQEKPAKQEPATHEPAKHEPAIKELAARSLVVLTNFSPEPKPKDRDALLRALLSTPGDPYVPPPISKWSNKIQAAKKPVCAVTGQEARYRDPVSRLPYLDGHALKVIRKLALGRCVWSETLECWLGDRVTPAVGVPPGFADPAKVRKMGDATDAATADAATAKADAGEKMDVSA